jgi:putative glutamine amidotransferase
MSLHLGITANKPQVIRALTQLGVEVTCLDWDKLGDKNYLDQIDGLVLPGNEFDVDPTLYGDEQDPTTALANCGKRAEAEAIWLTQALGKEMPVLGICGGAQWMNVLLGGSLVQDIPSHFTATVLDHRQAKGTYHLPHHDIEIYPGTVLHHVLKATHLSVNSDHHQAIKRLGKDLRVNAIAEDGVIEGFEHTSHPFFIGVQWHPEYQADPADGLLLEAFRRACTIYKMNHVLKQAQLWAASYRYSQQRAVLVNGGW